MKSIKLSSSGLPLQGIFYSLSAAALFGASTPAAKLFLGEMHPVLLAGLLYLGSGIGLGIWGILRSKSAKFASISRADLPYLCAAILFGGILGPVLLMFGLSQSMASTASLLLNLEGVLTAVIAWVVFKEHTDRRIVLGMLAIVSGGVFLSVIGQSGFSLSFGSIFVVAACLCWAIDNNITNKISAADPVQIAFFKGLIAGIVNFNVAMFLGAKLPSIGFIASSMVVGFLGYGISLAMFVLSLRHLGTARTGAYFSTAPFIGAFIALIVFKDAITWNFVIAAILMGIGLWLHLTERHDHEHTHEPIAHNHEHVHDEHHQHEHEEGVSTTEPHSHWHVHEELTHSHPHFPDLHHKHKH